MVVLDLYFKLNLLSSIDDLTIMLEIYGFIKTNIKGYLVNTIKVCAWKYGLGFLAAITSAKISCFS